MRLWSIHPRYLDTKGLVAVWREGLLALHVFSGKTKGYTKHPQLQRFQQHAHPIDAITDYLHYIVDEAELRKYKFNRQKLQAISYTSKIVVTRGQLQFETQHLKEKLQLRDPQKLIDLGLENEFLIHPFFEVIDGPIASWEKIKKLEEMKM